MRISMQNLFKKKAKYSVAPTVDESHVQFDYNTYMCYYKNDCVHWLISFLFSVKDPTVYYMNQRQRQFQREKNHWYNEY